MNQMYKINQNLSKNKKNTDYFLYDLLKVLLQKIISDNKVKKIDKKGTLNLLRNINMYMFEAKSELQLVFDFLKKKPASISMIIYNTGIIKRNVCWHVFTLEKKGKIVRHRDYCEITGKLVFYFSVIKKENSLTKSQNQLCLF